MAIDKNTMPKGTTHICMSHTHAFHAMRVYEGWCLQDGEGGWAFCGEEVSGHKVDIRTGIIWSEGDKVDNTRVLASVIRLKGERAIGVDGLRIPSGFSDVDHLITQRFVDGWEPSVTSKVRRKGFPVRAGVSNEQDPWMPMETAPRDGRQLRLLVAFTEHSTDDDERGVTIGANYLEQNDLDEWLFAGWSWTQDCYTSGEGEVIGWMPLLSDDPKVGDLGFYGRMAARLRLKNSELNRDLAKAEKALNAAMSEIKELKNAK